MTGIRFAASLTLGVLLLTGCQTPAVLPLTPTSAPDSEGMSAYHADQRTKAALEEIEVSADFEGDRLVNVIDTLRDRTGQDFFVNWPTLESVGVEADAPVLIEVAAGPLPRVLDLIIQQAGAVTEFDPIAWEVREGVIVIDTVRSLRRGRALTRVYDIRDLLADPLDPVEALYPSPGPVVAEVLAQQRERHRALLQSAVKKPVFGGPLNNTTSGGGPGPGEGLFAPKRDTDPAPGSPGFYRDEMIDLIQETTGTPEEWFDLGAAVRELNGNLIVKARPQVHAEIEDLLATLRAGRVTWYAAHLREIEVAVLLADAETHRLAGRYGRARGLVERALRVDPDSKIAQAALLVLRDL